MEQRCARRCDLRRTFRLAPQLAQLAERARRTRRRRAQRRVANGQLAVRLLELGKRSLRSAQRGARGIADALDLRE